MKGWIIASVVALALAGSYYLLSRPDPVRVSLVAVERGPVEQTVANTRAGTVEACQRSRLSFAIGGQIDRMLVDEGDRVEKNQLLMTLWNRDRVARVREAEATVTAVAADRVSTCTSARSDRREAQRLEGLVQRRLVSPESADLAVARAEASAAACEAARAREQQAEAALETARAVLAQTELRAPFAGTVAEVSGEVGEYSTPSPPGIPTPPAIDLLTDDCHYIAAPIDEVDAARVVVGMPVRVTLDAFRDREFPARVSRVAPYVLDREKQARTVEVEAVLADLPDDIRLLAGYSADMEVILASRDRALRIPTELLVDGNNVLVVNGEDRLEKRRVETGLANWRYTEIRAGLDPGDKIVGNIGAEGVVAGVPAKVAESTDD